MSLSVSSFPEAPPKLVRQPKWQVISSLKSSGRYLGTLLSKSSVPFLKGIEHFAKTHVKPVKGSIVRQRTKVLRSRSISKHRSSVSRSSIRPSSTVIDIIPISNDDKCFYAKSSDVDASSLNPTIDISLSPTVSPAALSTPTAGKDIPAISPTDPVKVLGQPSVQSLAGDSAHAHEAVVQNPALKEHEEVSSDSEPHDPRPPESEITAPLPISPPLTTQSLAVPAPSTEGRRRSHSASAGVKASATETVPPRRPRFKSETAISLPRLTTITPFNPLSSGGRDSSICENPIPSPQPPATGSTHASESTSMKKQRQQRRETISKRARVRSGASSKSTGSNKAMESPPQSPPLSAHMFNMRSAGSRQSANSRRSNSSPSTLPPLQPISSSATTAQVPKSSPEQMMDLLQAPPHLRPKTSDVAPPSLMVVSPGPSDDASGEQSPPLPSSVDRGRWLRLVAVPHAESWVGEHQQRRPRTAPEAVLMASW